MATLKGLYRCIDACNGEIRIMAARYAPGWYCLVAVVAVNDDVWEKFEDLVGGDNDYFEACNFFNAEKEGRYVLALEDTPEAAMKAATEKATSLLEGFDD